MKVIFLDIDGVLNTEKRLLNNNGELYVEKDKIELLKEIIDKTKAKVVLSSTWRVLAQSKDSKEYPKYEAFEIELEKRGIVIFDYTPVFLDNLVTIGAYTLYKGICGIVMAAINLYIVKLERGIKENIERSGEQSD